jgi:molybdopterin/thiamine biosynthesis adenylyltransferase
MPLYDRQEKLELKTDISITVVGVGGVGFWTAKFAAMTGIEEIHLFDPDTIETHNLNRLDLPLKFVGKNKADVGRLVISTIRPDCKIKAFGMKLQEYMFGSTDWLVDCTDNFESQEKNYQIALNHGANYMKVGYDGEQFSINNKVAEWGEAEDGYVVIPSWCVPASIVGALAVAKIVKYPALEVARNVESLFNYGKKKKKK